MQKETIFWYDLETYGTNPQHDRIAQFAGIRTSTDLEIIDEPIILYNKITEDYLPDPQACLVTGLTPQETNSKGLPEYQFIQEILKVFLRRLMMSSSGMPYTGIFMIRILVNTPTGTAAGI